MTHVQKTLPTTTAATVAPMNRALRGQAFCPTLHTSFHFILTTIYGLGSCYSHFIDRKIEAERLSDLPKVIQQV